MDVNAAMVEVERLSKELIDQRRIADTANRAAAGLTTILRGYGQMFPELETVLDAAGVSADEPVAGEDDGTPRGAEAVRRILHATPTRWWLVSELVAALNERGWLPASDNPANAIRTAVERLVNTSDSDVLKGRKDGKVAYAYMPDQAAPGYDFSGEEPF